MEKEWNGIDERDKIRAIVAGPMVRDGNGDLWLIRRQTGFATSSWAIRETRQRGHKRRGLQFCNVRTDETRFITFPEGDVPSTPELEGMAGTELRELLTRAPMDGGAQVGSEELRRAPDWLVPKSLEAIGFVLCETAHRLTKRPIAVVVRAPITGIASVVAVSTGVDRRLVMTEVGPTSAAGRACMGEPTVFGDDQTDLLGEPSENRRLREQRGAAFSLGNGSGSMGALVVFGRSEMVDPSLINLVVRALVREVGPLMTQAAAVNAAEQQELIDELTGQPNRRALEQAMREHGEGPCSVLYVALDQFGQLHEAARDPALEQAATVFRNMLRDYDVPARVVNEEFALFLPDTPFHHAFAVADRVRIAVAGSVFDLAGEQRALTCSLGVASVPETVSDLNDLLAKADQALDLAKAQGHNRVAAAPATCTMSGTSEGVDEPDLGHQGGPLA